MRFISRPVEVVQILIPQFVGLARALPFLWIEKPAGDSVSASVDPRERFMRRGGIVVQ